MEPTSPSSPGSEDSTLPLSQPGSDASDRSNGTPPASGSSSDTGPTFPDGVTLLPTPQAHDAAKGDAARVGRYGTKHGGRNLNDDMALISSSAGSPASPSAPPAAARPRTITAGSGPSSPVSFASLDPDGSWLKTYPDSSVQASLLGPPLERFYGTWPRSGSMHDGTVYAHPTLERPTSESGSSYLPTPETGTSPNGHGRRGGKPGNGHQSGASLEATLLHTPTTGDGTPRYDHRASPGYVRNKPVPNLDAQIEELLPTPTADHSRGLAQPGTDYQSLPNTVMDLLPTPRVGGMKNGPSAAEVEAGDPKHRIETAIEVQRLRGDHTNQPSEGGSE